MYIKKSIGWFNDGWVILFYNVFFVILFMYKNIYKCSFVYICECFK